MKTIFLGMFLVCCLQLCCSQHISCTVHLEGEHTVYRVSKSKGTMCHYYWTNATKHVVANHMQTTEELVVSQNDTTLITFECSEVIYYGRNCISEGSARDAICKTNCSKAAELHGRDDNNYDRTITPVMSKRFHYPLIGIFLLLLLVVGLLSTLRCQKRSRSTNNQIVADV